MSPPSRLLYVAPWVDLGGTSRVAVDWFETLDRERFSAIAVTTLPSRNRALHELVPHAREVWPLPDLMPGSEYPRFLIDLVRERGIDLLHLNNVRLPLLLLPDLAALERPPRVVLQLHDPLPDGLNSYAAERYDSLIDAYSVVSGEIAGVLRELGVSPSKIHVIHAGIDVGGRYAARPAPTRTLEGRFRVLWPARLAEQKDPLLMARVAAGLAARVPGAVVHAMGWGPLLGTVERELASMNGAVRLHGAEEAGALPSLYAACDAVLLTSRYEGIPLTLAESLALGRPVVAPALPGIAEIVDDDCALLVAPGSEAGPYVDALAALADDPAQGEALAAAGRRRVEERFDRRAAARAHAALYEELLA